MEKLKKIIQVFFGIETALLLIYSIINISITVFSLLLLLLCVINVVFMILIRNKRDDYNCIIVMSLVNFVFSIIKTIFVVNIGIVSIEIGKVYISDISELPILYISGFSCLFYLSWALIMPAYKYYEKNQTNILRENSKQSIKKESNTINTTQTFKKNIENDVEDLSETLLTQEEIDIINKRIKKRELSKKSNVLFIIGIIVFLPIVIFCAAFIMPIIEKLDPKSWDQKFVDRVYERVINKSKMSIRNECGELNADKQEYLEYLFNDYFPDKKKKINEELVKVIEKKVSIDEFQSCEYLINHFKDRYVSELKRLSETEDICHPSCLVVSVRFQNSNTVYYYLTNVIYDKNDKVIVPTQYGKNIASVIDCRRYCKNEEMPYPYNKMKSVIEKAKPMKTKYKKSDAVLSTSSIFIDDEDNNPSYNPWDDVPLPFYDDDGELIGYDMHKTNPDRFGFGGSDDSDSIYYGDDYYDEDY